MQIIPEAFCKSFSISRPVRWLLLLVGVIFTYSASAQVVRDNWRGEKIIVYPDGHITYADGRPVPATDTAAYPVYHAQVEPLDGPVTITEQDVLKIARRRSQLSRDAARLAQQRAAESTANRERVAALLAQAQARGDADQVAALERQFQAAQATERSNQREAQAAEQESIRSSVLTDKGDYIADYNARQRQRRIEQEQRQLGHATTIATLQPMVDAFTGFTAAPTAELWPPRRPCEPLYTATDERSGMLKRAAAPQMLFSYTDERLRPYLKEKDYLQCEGFVHTVGGFTFVTLNFTFAYPNAREAYGFIEDNSVLTIRLLNGENVNLRAGQLARGSYDTQREILTYSVYYPLDRSTVPILRNSEVDFVRVFWSSGYEEYPVLQMDFFQEQFRCLEQ